MSGVGKGFAGKIRGLFSGGAGPGEAARPTVRLACFGKHPGWEDHMDHLGVDNEHLTGVWRTLYEEGVRVNLDRGTWKNNLKDEHRLPGFDHAFLWRQGPTVDLGWMWASRDKKGRADYPMIACVSAEHASLSWLCEEGSRVLKSLRTACESTNEQDDVIRAFELAREELRASLERHGETATAASDPIAKLAGLETFSEEPERFIRFIYHIERECLPAASEGSTATSTLTFKTHLLRVPSVSEDTSQSLLLWLEALEQLVQGTPLFVCKPQRRDWADVAVGFPGIEEIFALLATPEAIPLVTSIPYEIEADQRARIVAMATPR
jgi:ribosomal protein S14